MTKLTAAQRKCWRRRRRQAYRQHHPDMGGTPQALAAALTAIDREFDIDGSKAPRDRVYVFSTQGPMTIIGDAVYSVIHYVQRRVTRRTYFDL